MGSKCPDIKNSYEGAEVDFLNKISKYEKVELNGAFNHISACPEPVSIDECMGHIRDIVTLNLLRSF